MGVKAPGWIKPAYVAEFVGTYLLVFTVELAVHTNGDSVWNPTAIASTLTAMIYALGPISGANFNPAVSLALGLCGELRDAAIYCIVQIVAGASAGFTAQIVAKAAASPPTKLLLEGPHHGPIYYHTAAAECVYTFVLCLVVLFCTVGRKNQYFGLAIGFVIVAGGHAVGGKSSGALNPAVAAGLDATSRGGGFMCYAVSEIVGAAAAAAVYLFIRAKTSNEGPSVACLLLSECIGTFVLVFTVGMNVFGASKAGAWSIAASLMSMVFALGDISGAHFNPAVTFAISLSTVIRGKCDYREEARKALLYIQAQFVGGFLGIILSSWVYDWKQTTDLKPVQSGASHFGWREVAMGEAMFTFMLCYVVLSVATTRLPLTQNFGLAIGLCVVAGGNAIGNVCSVACLNPAVAFAIDHRSHAWLYFTAFELAGALASVVLFWLTHPQEHGEGAPGKKRSDKGDGEAKGEGEPAASTVTRRPRNASPAPVANRQGE